MNSTVLLDDDTTFAFSIVSVLNEKFVTCFARYDEVKDGTKVTYTGPAAYIQDAVSEIKYIATTLQTQLEKTAIPVFHVPDQYTQFTVNAPAHFSNMLRRIILGYVPTMAIEFVHVSKHNSALNDDMLVHRLALIPVITDPAMFAVRQECTCEGVGCPWCAIEFELDFTNDTDDKKKQKYVRSQQLVAVPTHREIPVVIIPDIPIIPVDESRHTELKIKCIATKNRPRVHTKWASTCMCVCNPVIQINLVPDLQSAPPCPRNVFDVDAAGRVVVSRPDACSMCGECGQDVTLMNTAYWLRIESVGQLSPERIFADALAIIVQKCNQYTNNGIQ